MRCETFADDIGALVDGALGPDDRRALERHLEGCAECRALVADLRTIRAAAFTLERYEAPPRVWSAIKARLEAPRPVSGEPASRWRGGAFNVWLAAAAALLLATSVGIVSLTTREPAPDAQVAAGDNGPLLESVESELRQAEAHYQKAIDGLEAIARADTGELDPQVAAVLQKNLQVIDQAIGESRAALRVQPASAPAQESLFEAMRNKVALLQQTVELINEMRKGNQAESARIVGGLGPT
jgi:anti-sigma factor RsiW